MSQSKPFDAATAQKAFDAQAELDANKSALDSVAEPTEGQKIGRLFLDALSVSQTVLFRLVEGGPTIEQIKANIPGLSVIAQVGDSYGVDVPATGESLGKFTELYADLPNPEGAELEALEKEVEAKLSQGFITG